MKSVLLALLLSMLSVGAHAEFAMSAEQVRPLLIGAAAPAAVALTDVDGKATSLAAVTKGRASVLVFYRGGWCPYCNLQLADLRNLVKPLKEKNVALIAISPDQASELFKSVKKNSLDYVLLSDASATLIEAFGIGFKVDDMTKKKYAEYGIDLAKASGQDHSVLPAPSVFIVDAAGKVQFSYVNPDYSVRLSSKVVLAALDDLLARKK
jgi:peroxiredoxin